MSGGQVYRGGGRVNNVNHVGGQLNVITIECTFSTIIIPIIGHFTVEWSCTYFEGTKSPYYGPFILTKQLKSTSFGFFSVLRPRDSRWLRNDLRYFEWATFFEIGHFSS